MQDAVEIQIRSIAHGGAGVGTDESGKTWFVEGALPGERVEAEAFKTAKRFVRARIVRVIEAAPERVDPPCKLATQCGGCGWQHVVPGVQAEFKRGIVADQLRRLPLSIDGVTASAQALGYRRRARLHYERKGDVVVLGFHKARSRELVDVDHCPVLRPELDRALQKLRALADYLPDEGEAHAVSDGKRVVVGLPGVRPGPDIEEAATKILDEELVGLVVRGSRRRLGIGQTELQIDGGSGLPPTRVGPFVFSQAQAEQNTALAEHVVSSARAQRKRVLELYAGNGNFTRGLARHANRVWAFDDSREAVAAARRMAEQYGLSINAKQSKVDRTLSKMAQAKKHYDVVVLDPPRSGLGEAASRDLAKVARERIVYVSCDPATLARDLRVLIDEGFRVESVRVFDLMPMTPEVETVVTLLATSGGHS